MKNYDELLKTKKLKKEYESIVNKYIKYFEQKQGVRFNYWIGDRIGGVADFGDVLTFNFTDIVFDINTQQPKDLILNWVYESVDNPDININYRNYAAGLRYEHLKK